MSDTDLLVLIHGKRIGWVIVSFQKLDQRQRFSQGMHVSFRAVKFKPSDCPTRADMTSLPDLACFAHELVDCAAAACHTDPAGLN
jgi:hypothetical protein